LRELIIILKVISKTGEEIDYLGFVNLHNKIENNTKLNNFQKNKQLKKLYIDAYKKNFTLLICEKLNYIYDIDYSFDKNDLELISYTVHSNLINQFFNKNIKILNFIDKIDSNDKFGKKILHHVSISLIREKRSLEAIEILTKINKKEDKHHLDLALAYFKLKKFSEAKNICIKLINKKNDNSKLFGYFCLGEIALEENNEELVKNCYEKSLKLFSNNNDVEFRCIRLYLLYKFSKFLNIPLSGTYLNLAINTEARGIEDIRYKNLAIKEKEAL